MDLFRNIGKFVRKYCIFSYYYLIFFKVNLDIKFLDFI